MALPPFDVIQPFAREHRDIKEDEAEVGGEGGWGGVGVEKFPQKGISRLHKHSVGWG